MPRTDELLAHLDGIVHPSSFRDYGPNGLQVPGPDDAADVRTVATAVSANAETFRRAIAEGAELLVVHHGLLWGGPPRPYDRIALGRLRLLLDAGLALAAYHLPLDGHQELGNGALLAGALGAGSWRPFALREGQPLGVAADLRAAVAPDELVARVRRATGQEPLAFLAGPGEVRSVGVVTGAGGDHLDDALAEGLDAFVTGEPSERHMARAQEGGLHFLAAGHYATETFGVRALGAELASRFGVRHVFVDVPNPV
jgi:dinuclear metal center YbgI/SA1388 family protein